MVHKSVLLNALVLFALILSLVPVPALAGPAHAPVLQEGSIVATEAVVLVSSASSGYADFQHFIQPYLDHFGVPYTVLDIATQPVGGNIGDYAVIIAGHRQLDLVGQYLDSTEQASITAAVTAGTGLVNFDNDLASENNTPRYQFVQDIFGFTYTAPSAGTGVTFATSPAEMAYITARHQPGEAITTGSMTMGGMVLPAQGVSALASTGSQPFLAATMEGSGRAVQWGTYDWMSVAVKGPMYGLDDLVWRSFVWAARKPFVMQSLPPFVTMRVDDTDGPLDWLHIANEFGFRPWVSVFTDSMTDATAADLSALVNAELATASIHGFTVDSFLYFDHAAGTNLPDSTAAANFAAGTEWHQRHNIPISKMVVPHHYEIGTNMFGGLGDWGVQFLAVPITPGSSSLGAPGWVQNGPYRLYETGSNAGSQPLYYADYVQIPGHPEFANQFFNCMTEIRDDQGYDWSPNNDAAYSIQHGTLQVARALDSKAMGALFTHEYPFDYIGAHIWRETLQGITANLASYHPQYVTFDHACQYARAIRNSQITAGSYDPSLRRLTTSFSGGTDMPTGFYVYTEANGQIEEQLVDVPAFSGSTQVVHQFPGSLHHITVTPSSATVVSGSSQQFIAQGYNAEDNPIPNLPFTWSVAAGAGTIDPTGRFTAGSTPGSYASGVVASYGEVQGTASVEVVAATLHHFSFTPIASPQTVGVPFSVSISARDAVGNLLTSYNGTVQLSDSLGTIAPTTSGSFVDGVWAGTVTIGQASSNVVVNASDGSISGNSDSFAVVAETTPPTVNSVSPADGASDVSPYATATAQFSERVNPATVSAATFYLSDAAGNPLPAQVTYDTSANTATLLPAVAMANSTIYHATVKGGDSGVMDLADNALAADFVWSFTTAAVPPPPPDEGPGGPVLVVGTATDPFSRYYAEILRAEGLNAFRVTDISNVSASTLASYDVVILGQMPLTAGLVGMFTDWVNAGGNLIAMRPDAQLAGLLGLADAGSSLSDAYLLINTAAPPAWAWSTRRSSSMAAPTGTR